MTNENGLTSCTVGKVVAREYMIDDVAKLRRTASGCRVCQTAIVAMDGLFI